VPIRPHLSQMTWIGSQLLDPLDVADTLVDVADSIGSIGALA